MSACLDRPIEPLKLAKQIDILRELMYYPLVMRVMNNHAHQEGIPENVAFQEAIKYDRDIVPSFSASVYFTLAGNLARILSQVVYRVRLVHFDKALVNIDPEATVFFCHEPRLKHGLCLGDLFGVAGVCVFLCSWGMGAGLVYQWAYLAMLFMPLRW